MCYCLVPEPNRTILGTVHGGSGVVFLESSFDRELTCCKHYSYPSGVAMVGYRLLSPYNAYNYRPIPMKSWYDILELDESERRAGPLRVFEDGARVPPRPRSGAPDQASRRRRRQIQTSAGSLGRPRRSSKAPHIRPCKSRDAQLSEQAASTAHACSGGTRKHSGVSEPKAGLGEVEPSRPDCDIDLGCGRGVGHFSRVQCQVRWRQNPSCKISRRTRPRGEGSSGKDFCPAYPDMARRGW